jgi:hypothetical protein
MTLVEKCHILIEACKAGKLGSTEMPEDTNPGFSPEEKELQIAYFTLPMALNYQRDSFALWSAALKTYNDPETRGVFNVQSVANMTDSELQKHLLKYKLALQPNKHVATWKTIATTVSEEWGSFKLMFSATQFDFLKLRHNVQHVYKKDFPYLSGPKIFNYWSSILKRYVDIELENTEHIELAVDTHVLQSSVVLKVITPEEALTLDRIEIASRWRKALKGSGIAPADVHFVLWFWSRNGFLVKV